MSRIYQIWYFSTQKIKIKQNDVSLYREIFQKLFPSSWQSKLRISYCTFIVKVSSIVFDVYVAYNNAIFILFLQQSSFSEISSLEDILYTSCRSRDKANNREMGHLVSLSPSSWCILVVHHVRIVSMCYHLTSQRYTRVWIITQYTVSRCHVLE